MKKNDVIDNKKLMQYFKCSGQGGMRKSNETNSLVLISNHIKSIYDDRWIEDTFYYTGMGQEGEQSLSFMQNKTLNESNKTSVTVYLFEVFKEKEYTYIGEVYLADKPYQEKQPDSKQNLRLVWVFPLKLKENTQPVFSEEQISLLEKAQTKKVTKLSLLELKKRAELARPKTGIRNIITIQRERNPYISELAKIRANGICQLCKKAAPFLNKNKKPYLETHHIIWLSNNGLDSIENTVALCPNCHKKMHILNDENDIKILQQANKSL